MLVINFNHSDTWICRIVKNAKTKYEQNGLHIYYIIAGDKEVLEIFTNRLLALSPDSLVSELSVRVIHVFCSLGLTRHLALVTKIITLLLQSVLSAGVDLEDNNIVR